MAASSSASLQSPIYYHSSYRVHVRVEEPIWSGCNFYSTADLLCIISRLEILCKKQQMKKTDSIPGTNQRFSAKAGVLLERLQCLISTVFSVESWQENFKYLGIDKMFPHAAIYMGIAGTTSDGQDVINEYWNKISSLSQILTLVNQIKVDVLSLENQKYLAHQTAVLFQALGGLDNNSTSEMFSHEIRERFHELRNQLKQDLGNSRLDQDLSKWLTGILERLTGYITTSFRTQLKPELLQIQPVVACTS